MIPKHIICFMIFQNFFKTTGIFYPIMHSVTTEIIHRIYDSKAIILSWAKAIRPDYQRKFMLTFIDI